MQQLTLLDLPDVELLGALVEQGFGLCDLLARKAGSPYAEKDLRRFVYDSAGIPYKVRLATVEERWIQTMVRVTELLGFDADEETIRRHAEESASGPMMLSPAGPSDAASDGDKLSGAELPVAALAKAPFENSSRLTRPILRLPTPPESSSDGQESAN